MDIAIIEDEKIAADYLEAEILKYDPSFRIIQKIDSVSGAIAWLTTHHVDLLMVDIHLADDISFRIFEQLDISIPVIFTTAYDQYAIKAFKLNSVDYLLKPIATTDLHTALDKFKRLRSGPSPDIKAMIAALSEHLPLYQQRFLVSTGQKLRSVPVDQVAYFYSDQKLTFLTDTEGRTCIVDQSLDKLEPLLDPSGFFRINRQFIVSFGSIKNMLQYSKSRVKLELYPPTVKETIVSVERAGDFKQWLNR